MLMSSKWYTKSHVIYEIMKFHNFWNHLIPRFYLQIVQYYPSFLYQSIKKYPTFQIYSNGKEFSKFSFESINKIKDFLPKSKSRNRPWNEQNSLPLLPYYWNIIFKMEKGERAIVEDLVV